MEDKRENEEGDDGYKPIGYSDSHRVYFFSIVYSSFGLSPIIFFTLANHVSLHNDDNGKM